MVLIKKLESYLVQRGRLPDNYNESIRELMDQHILGFAWVVPRDYYTKIKNYREVSPAVYDSILVLLKRLSTEESVSSSSSSLFEALYRSSEYNPSRLNLLNEKEVADFYDKLERVVRKCN